MRKIQLILPVIFISMFSGVLLAGNSAQMLAVVEENAGHVSFYDSQDGRKMGSLQIGILPHEITITKDGKTAYVSNFGIRDYDSGSGIPGASISVIDIPNRVEKFRMYTFDPSHHKDYARIDSAPHGVKLRPPFENQLYVNIEKGSKVLIYDLATRSITKKIDVSPNTHNIFFSPDGNTLWLMAGKDGVIRIDSDTGKVTGSYVMSTPVRGLKYTPDNRYLMVSAVNQVILIDPLTLTVKKQFTNLGVGPILYSDITPDEKYIVAPAAFDNQVVIIDVESGKVVKRIVTGLNPVTVMIDASGSFAYITNATDKHVTKIDMINFEETRIHTKDGPNGITLVPFGVKHDHKKLTLGLALPLSGQDGPRGRDMMRGYEYWRLLVNSAGGLYVNGLAYDINVVYLDTQSDNANVAPLTKELISKYHVKMLLSTYSATAGNIEKQIALESHIPMTPVQTNDEPWQPNDMAVGHDYFVTSKLYDQQYFAQYNFKASTYSASATALGIVLQKSLLQANSMNYDDLTKILDQNKFNVFNKY